MYDGSIDALQKLNAKGYGKADSGLELSLVYNPGGPFLPPPQVQLEQDYKRELFDRFSIEFNQLFTITNMPISRFGSVLLSKGEFYDYMSLLKGAYSEENLQSVMCRNLISIDWQGYVYDCDFNQMLEMPLAVSSTPSVKVHISELLNKNIKGENIVVANHCYGCTAGQGSSCGGSLESA